MKKTSMKTMKQKPWTEMTVAELAKATKRYDRSFVAMNESKPLSSRGKRLHAAARRRGRPQIGDGADRVLVSIERNLLKRADKFAVSHGLKRSELIAKALTKIISADRRAAG